MQPARDPIFLFPSLQLNLFASTTKYLASRVYNMQKYSQTVILDQLQVICMDVLLLRVLKYKTDNFNKYKICQQLNDVLYSAY